MKSTSSIRSVKSIHGEEVRFSRLNPIRSLYDRCTFIHHSVNVNQLICSYT